MMRSMFAGVSGMRSTQMMMDVVGDNIANVNTAGYKASRVVFQDTLSQLLKDGSAGNGSTVGSTNPAQVGLGVHVNAVDAIQTQGAIQNTGRSTDVAIQGAGSFVVLLGTETAYTRAGSFSLDATNHLVDPSGAMLQGWPADATGAIPSTAPGAMTTLTVPAADPADATALLSSFAIADDGKLNAVYSNGRALTVGQIALATFSNPAGLVARGDGHFRSSPASGAAQYVTAGSGGSGGLAAGALEMSNVDLAQEFTNMMIAQRAFQANSKVISASDDMLQDLVNLKR
ncbi:MAG: flagellar hook-basal body complex protein [Mycobacteriales bacterium]